MSTIIVFFGFSTTISENTALWKYFEPGRTSRNGYDFEISVMTRPAHKSQRN